MVSPGYHGVLWVIMTFFVYHGILWVIMAFFVYHGILWVIMAFFVYHGILGLSWYPWISSTPVITPVIFNRERIII